MFILQRLSIGGSDTETFIFYMMLALRPALWLFMAAGRRPAARLGVQCIELVESVIILIGTDVHSRANAKWPRSELESSRRHQGDTYGVSGDRHHASHAASPCKLLHKGSPLGPNSMLAYAHSHDSA